MEVFCGRLMGDIRRELEKYKQVGLHLRVI